MYILLPLGDAIAGEDQCSVELIESLSLIPADSCLFLI